MINYHQQHAFTDDQIESLYLLVMRLFLALCTISSMLACKQGGPGLDTPKSSTPAEQNPASTATKKGPLSLNTYRDLIDLTGYEDLGSFHFRRLHFYTKTNPGISIGPAEVEEVTAYFIDRYVVKIRYKLSEDVAAYLVDSLTTDRERVKDLNRNWSKQRKITWNYFSKIITYQNKCPEDDLALNLTNGICDSPYWLYVELPGYKKKVKELKVVESAVREYLIDPASAKAASPD